jgi:nitrite reductase (NO-forming)
MARTAARALGGRVVVKARLICGSLLQRKYALRDRVQSDVRNKTCIRRSEPMLTRRAALFSAAAAALMLATPSMAAEDLKLPRQKVELVAPPFVHAHEQATRQGPRIMEFRLVIAEKKVVIDEKGTTFQAMTFNGSMPGPLIVVHEGDYVEVTLVNPATNSMPHNIDFHAATGALGGGALTLINPGE